MSMVGRSSFWFMPLLTGETETKMQDSIFERLQGGPEGVERRDARNKVSGVG
jgi:hypothetical protein